MKIGTRAYFDTSVLFKRYIQEFGSDRARSLARQYRPVSSAITPAEMLSALYRRRVAGDLTDSAFEAIVDRMRADRRQWQLMEVSPLLLDRVEEIVVEIPLRALDAIHVASALTFRAATGIPVPFITADTSQRDAAATLGLEVIWVD